MIEFRTAIRDALAEEGPRTGGWATGLLGAVTEQALHDLDDTWMVATDETPIPYSATLEDAFIPTPKAIVESVRSRPRKGDCPP